MDLEKVEKLKIFNRGVEIVAHMWKLFYLYFYIVLNSLIKKAPRQGIEPWFSDLESDVLTIERPGIS